MPAVVAILVPWLVLGESDGPQWDVLGVAGAALIAAGVAVWAWTVWLLARIGRGTLAPWDPTERLVVAGPYGHMRNPMITAVLAVLLGEAALFHSVAMLVYAAAFFALNQAFFLTYEEPALEERFGEEYRAYKRAVPRWVPKRRTTDVST